MILPKEAQMVGVLILDLPSAAGVWGLRRAGHALSQERGCGGKAHLARVEDSAVLSFCLEAGESDASNGFAVCVRGSFSLVQWG